ncbi:protein-serine O-palmitoleoyltransferase porcupine isoform X2 [Hermetia illucens]|uniref:protein-serine O-palmitoleoyltransferase porcupine isoform X2 n=1 Tax=Hermetia illucens TaxID=343691 RepID=UPI0018CC0D47|nr:protein-serine O-palmitoleoyltransferase porcupine isoform X2 [Hermetia illucens]
MNYWDDYPEGAFDDPDLFLDQETASLSEIYENCILPSVRQIYNYVEVLLFYSFLFRVLSNVANRVQRLHFTVHLVSIICGNLALLAVFGSSAFFCILYIYAAYFILFILINCWGNITRGILGYLMAVSCMIVLTLYEIFEWNPVVWRQIRGVQMVATMKVVSLSFDVDAGILWTTDGNSDAGVKSISKPDILSYLGYMFCPANCVLGPWVRYSEYISVARGSKLLDIKVLLWTVVNFVLVFIFAMASNCLVPNVIGSNSWKWLVAYRDALSFRCSHYFISSLSQLTMATSGFARPEESVHYSPLVGYQVVKPFSMEMPRSLSQVVTDWNIPIHLWLKQYIFRVIRRKSITLAIFLTYFVSSMLHEHNLRGTIAEYLSACVRANPCKPNCDHRLKRFSPICLIVNILFSGFTIVHLAFLGSTFNSTTVAGIEDENSAVFGAWNRWSDLNFASYWICFGCLLCDILLKV